MILILGPFPNEANEKDGMVQRVAHIDKLLKNKKRTYITSVRPQNTNIKLLFKAPRRFFKQLFFKKEIINNNITVFENIPRRKMLLIADQANKIYVHSLYSLMAFNKKDIEKYANKIIIDIHGCVVEEMEYMDIKKEVIKQFTDMENFAFNKVGTLIAVSDNMIDFYKQKYPSSKSSFLKLPIFTFNEKKLSN
ncbi:MAG: hypothetical protein PHE78_01560 [Candidatus Gastranaerophilales bacterium]|nr:hypothetical protein [Candidatus Gastranaerophilales bacterium]